MRVRILAAFAVALVCVSGLLVSASIAARSADHATAKLAARDAERVARAAEAVDTHYRQKANGKVEIRGVVQAIHVDPKDHEGPGKFRYALQLEGNRSVPITLPRAITKDVPPDEPALESGQIVTVTGASPTGTAASGSGAVPVGSIDIDGELPLYGPQPITSDPSTHRGTTTRTARVIPVAYADDPEAGPFDMAKVRQFLQGTDGNSVDDYFSDTSAGLESDPKPPTAGNITEFSFTIEEPLQISTNRPASAESCAANPELDYGAINRRLGIDPLSAAYGAYDHYLYLMPCNRPGALAEGDLRGAWSAYYAPQGTPSTLHTPWTVGTFIHELGHNLGLHHTNRSPCTVAGIASPTSSNEGDCSTVEYGGGGDVMGRGDDKSSPAGLLSPFHRAKLGFLPLQNAERVAPVEGRVTSIASSTTRDALGTRQLVQIRRPKAAAAGTDRPYYYLGFRGPKGPFESRPTNHPLYNGVELQRSSGLSALPMLQPETVDTQPSVGAAPVGETRSVHRYSLTAGRSFYDPLEDFTITTRSVTTGVSADVTVEPGPPRGPATSVGVTAGRLLVRASGSSANSVSIAVVGSDLVVADFGNVVTPGSGCARAVAADPQIVRCPASAISAISVWLGLGSDQATVASDVAQPVMLDGGDGDDTLVANGAGADVLTGGRGNDFLDPSGNGSDTVSYGDHTESVVFDQTAPKPWTVTTASGGSDEIAHDQDNVVVFERFIGGGAADTLRWTAGSFARTIEGGGGADIIRTGPMADVVLSRDGIADSSIDCGEGSDVYDGDAADPATSCSPSGVVAVIVGGPLEGASAKPGVAFALRSYLATETFQCRVAPDQTAYSQCGTSFTVPVLPDGPKTLMVKAVVNGVASSEIAQRSFVIDGAAPSVTVTSTPPAYDTGRYATFAFEANERTGRFTCRLDGVDRVCQSPVSFADLPEGTHTFSVRALDEASNLSASSPVTTWTVARNLPNTQITGGPTGSTTVALPRFDFTSTGPAAAGFDCRIVPLDDEAAQDPAFGACSGATFHQPIAELPLGRYRFDVRARNALGGVDQSPDSREFMQLKNAGSVSLSGTLLKVDAAPGRENQLKVRTGANSTIIIEDQVPLQAVNCVQITPTRVTCPDAGIATVNVYAGDLDDRIDANLSIPVTLFGQTGNDTLRGIGSGRDAFVGGTGVDTVTFSGFAGPVTLSPGSAVDDGPVTGTRDLVNSEVENLVGGDADDVITGSIAGAVLDGGPGTDRLTAPAGGATFIGSPGADTFVGSVSSNDTVDYSGLPHPVDVTVNAAAGTALKDGSTANPLGFPATDSATEVNRWIGTPGNDRFKGTAGADDFVAGRGWDKFTLPPGGIDHIDGGDGIDTLDYSAYVGPVRVSLLDATPVGGAVGDPADIDTLTSVQHVVGGSGNDVLIGDGDGNSLNGGAGDDTLVPGPGAPEAADPDGDGVAAFDAFLGGPGNDLLDMSRATVPLTVDVASAASTSITSPAAARAVPAVGVERFIGGSADDVMKHLSTGLDVAAAFDGGPGHDALTGGNAIDALTGGTGNDTLTGGGGKDAFDGGDGVDTVYARDGVAEAVACGAGSPDAAQLDTGDTATGCETQLP